MKLTKNIITREKARKLCPDYVEFVEGNFDKFDDVWEAFDTLQKGQKAITCVEIDGGLVFCQVKVTSINHDDFRAVDGPVVRVGNDEYTWRCDGDKYAYPINI